MNIGEKKNIMLKPSFSFYGFLILLFLVITSSVFIIMLIYGKEFLNPLSGGLFVLMSVIGVLILKEVYLISSFDENHGGVYNLFVKAANPTIGHIFLWFSTLTILLFISSSILKLIELLQINQIFLRLLPPILLSFILLILSIFGNRKLAIFFYLSVFFAVALFISVLILSVNNILELGAGLSEVSGYNFVFSDITLYSLIFCFIISIPLSFLVNEIKNKRDIIPMVMDSSPSMVIILSSSLLLFLYFIFSLGDLSLITKGLLWQIFIYSAFGIISFFSLLVIYSLSWMFVKISEEKSFFLIASRLSKNNFPFNASIIVSVIFMGIYTFIAINPDLAVIIKPTFDVITLFSGFIMAYVSYAVFSYRNRDPDKFEAINFKMYNVLFISASLFFLSTSIVYASHLFQKLAAILLFAVLFVFLLITSMFFKYLYEDRFVINISSFFSIILSPFSRRVFKDSDSKFYERMLPAVPSKILLVGYPLMPYIKKIFRSGIQKDTKYYVVSCSEIEYKIIKRMINRKNIEKNFRILFSQSQQIDTRIPKVDSIFCINFISRLSNPNLYLININQTLKKEGYLFLADRRMNQGWEQDKWFNKDAEVVDMLKKSGFTGKAPSKRGLIVKTTTLCVQKEKEASLTPLWSKVNTLPVDDSVW